MNSEINTIRKNDSSKKRIKNCLNVFFFIGLLSKTQGALKFYKGIIYNSIKDV